jgi:iron complex outermembrane receptor protein
MWQAPFQLHDLGPQEWRQFSQEIRLASSAGEALEYQVGAFYMNIESERNFTRDASCQNNAGQLDQAMTWYANETLTGTDLTAALADLDAYAAAEGVSCNANDIISATAFMSTEFNNWAVFGDGKYSINDSTRLLFGMRTPTMKLAIATTAQAMTNMVVGALVCVLQRKTLISTAAPRRRMYPANSVYRLT